VILPRAGNDRAAGRSFTCLRALRAEVFGSTVTVASRSRSAGNSISDGKVGFGLRVFMSASLLAPWGPDVDYSCLAWRT
jgi:hypothetical protein